MAILLVSDLRPINILIREIMVEVTGVVGVSPALWYFRYIASIFLTQPVNKLVENGSLRK